MSSANSFGSRFVITTFGESHGPALGAVIDGMPAGLRWDEKLLNRELARRRPGQSSIVTSRRELDLPEVLSGIYQGKTLGTPIAIIVRNHDARSDAYRQIAKAARIGHADDMWQAKFSHRDPRGGGRSSGRETLSRVIGGACAQMLVSRLAPKVRVKGWAGAIGPMVLSDSERQKMHESRQANSADQYAARFPSAKQTKLVEDLLLAAKAEGLSYGGIAEISIEGLPVGLGQPVFHKLKSELAQASLGLGATSGFEIGEGFAAAAREGSKFHTSRRSARYGGVRGGISTGEAIFFRVAFKPTASVLDVAKRGRHDPCIVPRAIPVLQAMANLVIADHLLWSKTDKV